MSNLRDYEISFWRDKLTNGELSEEKVFVFGADKLET
jgi:hypothetical protein